jgi:hypothetical protein
MNSPFAPFHSLASSIGNLQIPITDRPESELSEKISRNDKGQDLSLGGRQNQLRDRKRGWARA